jgi:hypothetical protein
MANFRAVHTVGDSLISYLTNSFPADLRNDIPCGFRLISSGELAGEDVPPTTVTLLLYRVTVDENLRNTRRWNDPSDRRPPLALDLHYLLTVWADSPRAEQVILGWALRQINLFPVLDRSLLKSDGGWLPDDTVQLIPAELSTEDMMRIWDTLKPNYRLSVSFVARAVRIDPDDAPVARPVVVMRSVLQDSVEDEGP